MQSKREKLIHAKRKKAIRLTNSVLSSSRNLSESDKLGIKKSVFDSVMNKKPETAETRKLKQEIMSLGKERVRITRKGLPNDPNDRKATEKVQSILRKEKDLIRKLAKIEGTKLRDDF